MGRTICTSLVTLKCSAMGSMAPLDIEELMVLFMMVAMPAKKTCSFHFLIPIVWVLRIVRCEGDDFLRCGSCDLKPETLVGVGAMECFF